MLRSFEIGGRVFCFCSRIIDIFDLSAYRALIHVNQLNRWFCVEREDQENALPQQLDSDAMSMRKNLNPICSAGEVQMEAAKVCVKVLWPRQY